MFFLKFLFLLAIFSASLFALSFDKESRFYNYYVQIEKIEKELISLEVNEKYDEQAQGDFKKFFDFYDKDLNQIVQAIKSDGDITSLEKRALLIYSESVKANQVYESLYTMTGAGKEDLLASRNEIIDQSIRPIPDEEHTNRDQLYSFIYSLYGENLFRLIRLDKKNTIRYALELERQENLALRYDPDNLRAYLVLGIYYVTIANLNKLNLSIAYKYLNIVLDKGDEFMKFQALIWMSQYFLVKLNYERADTVLEEASAIYPKSGFLRYAKSLVSRKRLIKYEEGLTENTESANFFYDYSIRSDKFFEFLNYFNFITGDKIVFPYLGAGVNFSPLASLLEVGGGIKLKDSLTLYLGFINKISFRKIGGQYYSGVFGVDWGKGDWKIENFLEYGLIWKYLYQNNIDEYEYDQTHGIGNLFQATYQVFQNYYHQIDLQLKIQLFYSFATKSLLQDNQFSILGKWFQLGWSHFDTRLSYYESRSSNYKIYNRVDFFQQTPFPVRKFSYGIRYYPNQSIGDRMVAFDFIYRFYPFYFMNSVSLFKSIFIAPSLFFGWVPGATKSVNYSILGNIGFTFPGGNHITFGMGWNPDEEWVINLLAYAY